MAEEGLATFGAWVVERELGRGSMGVVYAVFDRGSGERRALKTLRSDGPQPSAEALALFEREVRICTELRHPHLVRLDGSGHTGAVHWLVMELCEGGSLMDLVRTGGPLPAARAVPLVVDVLDGLTYAHEVRGAVHRDIKPQNILLGPGTESTAASRPVAKIADFGLAKAYATAGLSGLTATGSVSGTPAFMPRAQLVNYKYAQPHVDVWATAATLYFLLTGHTPRDFPVGRDPWLTVTTTAAVPVGERGVPLPDRLERVLDRALRDGPEPEFRTADAFKKALQAT
ncbi:serine/threonine protein kinase [Streptomyces sp. NBC_00536]|uniref:serine/threonine-protein kinase n=1 Tax=Streptomyces sp. NBC_00536 TaxID=2975769 RepID=UPI002E813538|nr:serine/threonine-protein kinase [Streptomyces sp. NBC_00536]WUC76953.1 serine/threonine protein kinase [Streptomyces sp. NBC_00536]